jgi:hypothetical protein
MRHILPFQTVREGEIAGDSSKPLSESFSLKPKAGISGHHPARQTHEPVTHPWMSIQFFTRDRRRDNNIRSFNLI